MGGPTHTDVLRQRLRTAALVSFAADALLLPLSLHYRPAAELPAILGIWVVHLALTTVALLASYGRVSEKLLDRLILGLVLAWVLDTELYLWLSPREMGLVTVSLTMGLMASAVFFDWSWRRTAVVSSLVCGAFALVAANAAPLGGNEEPTPLLLGGLVVGALIATASAGMLEQFRSSLAHRESKLAALSARLMSIQEDERRRISRELHEEVGQSLSAVNSYLWLIERELVADGAPYKARIAEARQVVGKTLTGIRELSGLLRPVVLDDFGLVPSLDAHLKAFADRHEIATSLTVEGLPERLPPQLETALYRIAQEALTNVARHAQAHRVRVRLAARGRELRLDIEDDGVGLRASGHTGLGLIGIHERVRALGGTVSIASDRGASLSIRLPLPRAA